MTEATHEAAQATPGHDDGQDATASPPPQTEAQTEAQAEAEGEPAPEFVPQWLTLADMAWRPGAREIAEVASSSHQPIVDAALLEATLRGQARDAWEQAQQDSADEAAARVREAIIQAEATICGYLAQRGYILPLPLPEGSAARPLLRGWARAIARYLLHIDRVALEDRDPIVRDWREALRMLELIASGRLSLGGDDALLRGQGASASDVRFQSVPSVFGREQLAYMR